MKVCRFFFLLCVMQLSALVYAETCGRGTIDTDTTGCCGGRTYDLKTKGC